MSYGLELEKDAEIENKRFFKSLLKQVGVLMK